MSEAPEDREVLNSRLAALRLTQTPHPQGRPRAKYVEPQYAEAARKAQVAQAKARGFRDAKKRYGD